jgi:hypothetical protein
MTLHHTWFFRIDLDFRGSLGRRTHPDAVVVQEDRNLVMAPAGFLDLDATDDLDAAYAAARSQRPLGLGEFLVIKGRGEDDPWIYQAVVHDLELEQSCRPGDVRRALCGIVRDAEQRGLGWIAVEQLGRWLSRGLSVDEMAEAMDEAVLELTGSLRRPVRITVLVEEMGELEEVSHQLRSRLLRRARRSFRTVGSDTAVVEVRNGNARYHVKYVPGTLSGYVVNRVPVGT